MNNSQRITYLLRIQISILLVFSFGSALRSQNLVQPKHFDEIVAEYQDFVEETFLDWNAPGLAVAIVKDDSIVFMKGYGVRKVGNPEKIDEYTVFRLASVSKTFASVLAGLLVQKNVLRWDDPLVQYLPKFALRDSHSTKQLTIRHVLSHTSGLPPHAYTNLLEADVPYSEILIKLQSVKSVFPVGKRYGYQNIVYSLIGDVVESATGETYEDLVAEHIFRPLGMNNASLGKVPYLMSAYRATPHTRRSGEWTATDVKDGYYAVPPSAGVNASVSDLAKWLRAMMGMQPQIIPPEVIAEVTKPHAQTPQELRKYRWRDRLSNAHYGLGWRIYHYAGTKIVYHGGWVEGFRAEIGFIPEQKVGIVVLVNAETMMANLFLPQFFDLYLNISDDDSTSVAE